MNTYEGKVALVTGGAAGIGLATVYAFARAGASVVIADNDAAALEHAAAAVRAQGHRVLAVACDVTDRAQVKAMVDETVATFGRLEQRSTTPGSTVTGASAGNGRRRVRQHPKRQSARGLELHEGGTAPDDGAGRGRHRQLLLDWRPARLERTRRHSASKFGIIGLTRASALDYAARAFASTRCAPASSATRRCRAGREEQQTRNRQSVHRRRADRPSRRSDEVAAAVVWLCSPAASFMVGHALAVDGGVLA